MNQQPNTKISKEELISQFCDEIKRITSDDTITPEEIMIDVCTLVEAMIEDITKITGYKFTFQTERDIIENDTNTHEPRKVSVPYDAHVYLMAKNQYLEKCGLTEEAYEALPFIEVIDTRKNITAIYETLIQNKIQNETKEKLGGSPFKQSLVSRVIEDENDPDNISRTEWYSAKIQECETELRSIAWEVESLEKQNGIKNISPMLQERNITRLQELKDSKNEIESTIQNYYDKLQQGRTIKNAGN